MGRPVISLSRSDNYYLMVIASLQYLRSFLGISVLVVSRKSLIQGAQLNIGQIVPHLWFHQFSIHKQQTKDEVPKVSRLLWDGLIRGKHIGGCDHIQQFRHLIKRPILGPWLNFRRWQQYSRYIPTFLLSHCYFEPPVHL